MAIGQDHHTCVQSTRDVCHPLSLILPVVFSNTAYFSWCLVDSAFGQDGSSVGSIGLDMGARSDVRRSDIGTICEAGAGAQIFLRYRTPPPSLPWVEYSNIEDVPVRWGPQDARFTLPPFP